jgi:hypothetical protein
MSVTEDGVTDLMANYLRDNDIDTVSQVSITTSGTRSQPDFQVKCRACDFGRTATFGYFPQNSAPQ